jgi:hypothetical protein
MPDYTDTTEPSRVETVLREVYLAMLAANAFS